MSVVTQCVRRSFSLGLFFLLTMRKPKLNRVREKRIIDEIVVDAYTPDERAMGWYYYLDDRLRFPFKAKCITAREVSPLKKGEDVEVLGMAPEDDCMKEMFVLVGFSGRRLGVPLVQLDPVEPDKTTREAMGDWRYWVTMGYVF